MSQTFGGSLREARDRKGLSLRQIATATKIPVATLEGLERDDFSRLPGGLFSRAFVRSFAIEVGLDPDEMVERFLQQVEGKPSTQQPAFEAPVTQAAPQHQLAPRATSALRDLAPESEFESRQRIAGVVLRLVVASVPIAAALLFFSSRGEEPAPAKQAREARVRSERVAVPEAASAAKVALPATPEPAVRATRGPEAITIEIAPSADCWAMLTADGQVVFSGVVAAGQRERRSFSDTATLKVGDAAACAILIDGRPARPLGPPKRVREIRMTRDNYTSFLP